MPLQTSLLCIVGKLAGRVWGVSVGVSDMLQVTPET